MKIIQYFVLCLTYHSSIRFIISGNGTWGTFEKEGEGSVNSFHLLTSKATQDVKTVENFLVLSINPTWSPRCGHDKNHRVNFIAIEYDSVLQCSLMNGCVVPQNCPFRVLFAQPCTFGGCQKFDDPPAEALLICSSGDEKIVQSYFTGLDDRRYKPEQGGDIPKTALIKVVSNTSALYRGQTIQVDCTAVRFVSTPGILFTVRWRNESDDPLPPGSVRLFEDDERLSRFNFSSSSSLSKVHGRILRLTTTLDMVGVTCHVPWYNSAKWITQQVNFTVKDGLVPTIYVEERPNTLLYVVQDSNIVLTCKTAGDPVPTIQWLLNNIVIPENSSLAEIKILKDGESFVILREIKQSHAGRYACVAKNYFGMDRYEFSIQVKDRGIGTLAHIKTIGSILLLVLLVVLIFSLIMWKLDEYPENIMSGEQDDMKVNFRDVQNREVDKRWEVAPETVTAKGICGKGAYRLVKDGTLHKGDLERRVALKTIGGMATESDLAVFWDEFFIISGLGQHPNIVELVGILIPVGKPPSLILEFCAGGDLRAHLQQSLESPFRRINCVSERIRTWSNRTTASRSNQEEYHVGELDKLQYARQIAGAMEYLAGQRIIHRDLAARNVLVMSVEKRIVKVADFGLSRDVSKNGEYKKRSDEMVPFKWVAVECLVSSIYTTASDIWSFGILFWEIVTNGSSPYPDLGNRNLETLLKEGYRMEKPDSCKDEWYRLMRKCWAGDPNDRGDFTKIRRSLDELIRAEKSMANQVTSL